MIKEGSEVTLHYTLTVDGEVVDSSHEREPLTFVQGSGQIIPGLEEKLEGLQEGEKKEVLVDPESGFGKPNPEAVQTVPRSAFQNEQNLTEGDIIKVQSGGREFHATVTTVSDEEVMLDLNHPLAGKTLQFNVEVVAVREES